MNQKTKLNFQIIWIDDEWEKNEAILDRESEGFHIKPFKVAKDGIAELEKNLEKYDAVILDAKGFKDSEDEVAKLNGLKYSIDRIKELSKNRVIPHFIFTGQKDLMDDDTFNSFIDGIPIFKKGLENDALFERINLEIQKRGNTLIKNEYPKLFKACEFISPKSFFTFSEILKNLKNPSISFNDTLHFNPLRKELELLFRKANQLGLLHDKCISEDGEINLSESSNFLSGYDCIHLKIRCKKAHFTKIISDMVKNIIFLTGSASHTQSDKQTKKYNFDKHKREIDTPYLLYSITFQLIDIFIWFEKYALLNSDKEKNKKLWSSINTENVPDFITGILELDSNRNYHCGECILLKGAVENKFKIGDSLKVTSLQENGNKSKNGYKYFSKNVVLSEVNFSKEEKNP
ncbi:hypothetical protein [Aquiflexum sp.]|uniref:hypothetical protein n=1 Tax=Aquiflexum sp. TaxID=1872584 RepID=UPI003592FEE3